MKLREMSPHPFYAPNKQAALTQLGYATESLDRDDPEAAVKQIHAAMGAALACASAKNKK